MNLILLATILAAALSIIAVVLIVLITNQNRRQLGRTEEV